MSRDCILYYVAYAHLPTQILEHCPIPETKCFLFWIKVSKSVEAFDEI